MINIEILLLLMVFSFLISCIIIYLNKKFGSKFLDNTIGIQKFHNKPTSRLGGISLFISSFLLIFFLGDSHENRLWTFILVSSIPLFLLGTLEDFFKNIRPFFRLLSAFFSGGIFIFLTGYSINTLNFQIVDNILSIYFISFVFTSFAIAGVSNSINIIDGFNGLASGSLIIMLITFSIVAWTIRDIMLFNFCILYVFILIGFFLLNFPNGYIFLGDSGAYFSGFLLAIIAIMLPARNPEISSWVSLLICFYPIMETIFSIFRKFKRKGHHPSKPDSVHFHMLVYRGIARNSSKKMNLVNFRNPITSIFMWGFPIINSIMALFSLKETYLPFFMVILTLLIYLLIYKKVSLNW